MLKEDPVNIVDEAWNLFDNEIMAQYLNAQSRMARKYGGQPIFISQKVDDFITSKHIGKTLVVNSHIKVLLDMAEYSNDFDDIQEILGLTAKQKQMVLSLNKDISEKRKYREIAICWKEKVGVSHPRSIIKLCSNPCYRCCSKWSACTSKHQHSCLTRADNFIKWKYSNLNPIDAKKRDSNY